MPYPFRTARIWLYQHFAPYRFFHNAVRNPVSTLKRIRYQFLLTATAGVQCFVQYGLAPLYRFAGRFRRKHRNPRVLYFSIISHKPFMLTRLLQNRGIEARYLALNTDLGYLRVGKRGYDYGIPSTLKGIRRQIVLFWYLLFVLPRFDILHIHFNTLLFFDGFELRFLKAIGRKIIFHFRGCDMRSRSRNNRLFPGTNVCGKCDYPDGSCDSSAQNLRLELARKYGDHYFATTPDLAALWGNAEWLPFIVPPQLIAPAPVSREESSGPFRVVTSSNHDALDGTEYIREAILRLRQEGESIDLVEVHGMPYEDALEAYSRADVYVGKLRLGYYNNANIETMVMEIPNLSYIRPEFTELAGGKDCPIINTSPEEVYRNLRWALEHRSELPEIGRKSRSYILERHDPDILMGRLIQCYRELHFTGKIRDPRIFDYSLHSSVKQKTNKEALSSAP